MQISDTAQDKLKSNIQAKAALCSAFSKHMKTIEAWIEDKDVRLTTPIAIKAIAENTDLTENEILEPITAKA